MTAGSPAAEYPAAGSPAAGSPAAGSPAAGSPAAEYPAFSAAELGRRRGALANLLAGRGLDHALLYGADRSGSAVQWLTGWPVTREAAVVFSPRERDVLFVRFGNHVPNARRLAPAADVRPGGASALEAGLAELRARRPAGVGVIGPVPARQYGALADAAGVAFLDQEYARLRMVKSAAEVAWLRRGAQLTDLAVAALAQRAAPGMTEAEVCAVIEGAYLGSGAVNHIHYLAVTPMDAPQVCVPAQWPSQRRLRAGDVLSCEVSASYWGYPGQLLRTFAVGTPALPRYLRLHTVAEAAFDAMAAVLRAGATARQLLEAASVITEAGFTVYDDILHGFGGGYLPPVLSRGHLESGRAPDVTLAAGMTVVIQPNVITRDELAGVQTGELVLVTEAGWEPLHRFPRGLTMIG